MALELALPHAGLIRLRLPYHNRASLEPLVVTSCEDQVSRSLIWPCKRRSKRRKVPRLHWERKSTICSIIQILQSRATRRVRLPWEGTETPSLKMQRVISPTTSAEYSPPSVVGGRFNWTHGSPFEPTGV